MAAQSTICALERYRPPVEAMTDIEYLANEAASDMGGVSACSGWPGSMRSGVIPSRIHRMLSLESPPMALVGSSDAPAARTHASLGRRGAQHGPCDVPVVGTHARVFAKNAPAADIRASWGPLLDTGARQSLDSAGRVRRLATRARSPTPETATPGRPVPAPPRRAAPSESTAASPQVRAFSFATLPLRAPDSSRGESLDAATRASMEARLRHDLSHVRVHTGSGAADAARALEAQAFTTGQDIVFGEGAYAPTTEAGQRLLMHELTHVVQGDRFGPARGSNAALSVSLGTEPAEREADRVARGETTEIQEAPSASIARQGGGGAAARPNPIASFLLFEDPAAATPAGAVVAFDRFLALAPAAQDAVRRWSYATAGKLYQAAAARVPAGTKIDRSGAETFNYWPSEIYSLLKEFPYWTQVTPADAAKPLSVPGGTSNAARLNYDPRGMIESWLRSIQSNWEPSLVNGVVRGFYKRILNDPSMKPMSVSAFVTLVKKVFPAPDATAILK
jgi:hypothetical protein